MKSVQQSLMTMVKEHSARKYLAAVVCLVAVITVAMVFWALRISGITLADEDSGSATYTDAGASEAATGTDSASADGISTENSDDGEEESGNAGISLASDEWATLTTSNYLSNGSSDYYLATTVDANNLTSGNDYIIYTLINDTYYVLTSDGNLAECTTVSSVSDATGDGPYYIESTGMIIYGASNTSYSRSVWAMTESGSDSSYYYAKNTGTGEYLAASGSGNGSDVTIVNSFSVRTGELTFYGDFELTYTFKNTCNDGGQNYYNYIVEMAANGVYLDVRADNYGWFAPDSGYDSSDTLTFGAGSSDWNAWLTAMQAGADVTVTITRSGSDIAVRTTAAGETFTATAYVSEYADDAALTVYLTGENCTISDVTYTATVNTVQLAHDSATLNCGATGATLAGTPLSVIATISNSALTWADSTGTTGTVFYFAEVQEVGDNYHFMETVTLTDAAENQDDSYIVYTKIDDTYYVVSAVDGSLLECTDLSSYNDEDEKVLRSTAAGAYIWDYDDTTGEPEFKFTTGTDGNNVDYFENYRWSVSSSDYDAKSGTGTYTLNNTSNDDYLAPELAVTTDTVGRLESSSNTVLSDYGKVEYTITVDASYQSGGVGYVQLRTYIYHTNYTARRISVLTPYVAVGTDWSGSDITIDNNSNGYGDTVGYGMGTMSLSVGDVLTLTITTAEDNIILNYYNQTTNQTCVYYIDLSGENPALWFASGARIYIYSVNGSFTVSAVTATYDSATYGASTSITENSNNGTYTVGNSLSEVGASGTSHPTLKTLSGDFDVTYAFTDKTSDSSNLAFNFTIEVNNGKSSPTYIDVNFASQWTYNPGTGTFSTTNNYSDDTTDLQAALSAGADCEARVVRTGNNFLFVLSATYSGTTYTKFASITMDEFDGCDVNIYLMGEYCTISGLTYTNNTVGTYNETTYDRVADAEISVSLTASDSNGSSVTTVSYLWTAAATGYYDEELTLIGQLATDAANTAEIEWVEDTAAGADATGTATVTLTNATVSSLSDTVAVTFSLARVRQYTVHFDPTNGATATSNTDYNATVYYYEDGNATAATQSASSGSCAVTSYSDAVGNCYIRLATALSSDNYPYDLQGWYDIYNNIYYSAAFAGEEMSITDNTVMYADWVIGSDYQAMDGTETGALAEENKLDTTGFITTEVFDYNSLVNLYSATLYGTVTGTSSSTGTATYSTYVNGRDHLELWGLAADPLTTYSSYATTTNTLGTTSWGFLFINNRAGTNSLYTGLERVGSLSYLLGRNDNGYNAGFEQGITTKIYADTGVDLFSTLFNRSNGYTPSSTLGGTGTGTLGVNYLGTGNYLYQYDDDTGYYYYDSSRNAAYYYNNRFYLFDCTIKGNASGTEDDFLPFNYPTITDNNGSYSAATIAYSNTNYFFGMKSTVSFYLPDDTGTVNASNTTGYGNMSDAGDKMVFRFMGDDDVWVYVDDELTLDLGGTHGAIYGEIDFSVGTVSYITNTTEIAVDDAGNTKPYVDLCFDTSSDVLKLNEDIVYEDSGKLYIKVEAVTGTNRVYYQAVSSSTATSSTVTAVEVGYTQSYFTEAGTHTLYFYYMERGGSESNCKIYFSLSSTTYSLDLTKVDESGNTYGTDAKFSIYTKDSNETLNILPLIETGSTETRLATSDDDENDYVYTFTSSQEISGLREGILYYVYEVDSPDGLTAAGRYFTIILEGDVLTITVYDSSGEKLDTYEYLLTITGDVTNGYTATYTEGSNTSLSSDSWKYVDTSNMTVVPTVAGQTVTNYKIAFGFKIVNTKEYELPATGGVGITPYIQTGRLLVMAAVLGLAMAAFYGLVRARRRRTAKYKEEGIKEKGGRKRSCAGTRDRPWKRSLGHGHARGHPGSFRVRSGVRKKLAACRGRFSGRFTRCVQKSCGRFFGG